MHERALAEEIISTVSRIAKENGIKEVTEVKIRLGELQQIEPETLEFLLLQIRTAIFKNTKFNIETVKTRFKCKSCGNEWVLEKERLDKEVAEAIHLAPELIHAYIKCPKCDSSDLEILHGHGMWIEDIKGTV